MLGSRKLLIFVLVFAVVFSLSVVCASAEEFEPYRIEDFSLRPAPVRSSSHQPLYVLNYSSNDALVQFLTDGGYSSAANVYSLDFPLFLNVSAGFDYPVSGLYSSGGSIVVVPQGYQFSSSRYLWSDSASFYSFLVDVVGMSPDDIEVARQGTILGMASEVFISILGIGSSLVSFVITRPIVLLPLVAMVFVLVYGVIRRLIKGV